MQLKVLREKEVDALQIHGAANTLVWARLCFFSRMIFNSLSILKNDEDPILFMHVHTYRIYLIYLSYSNRSQASGDCTSGTGLSSTRPSYIAWHLVGRSQNCAFLGLLLPSQVVWALRITTLLSVGYLSINLHFPQISHGPGNILHLHFHMETHWFGCSGFVASCETAAF